MIINLAICMAEMKQTVTFEKRIISTKRLTRNSISATNLHETNAINLTLPLHFLCQVFIILPFLSLSATLFAQQGPAPDIRETGIYSSVSLSAPGYFLASGIQTGTDKRQFVMGICTSLNDILYLNQYRPGLQLGYKVFPGKSHRSTMYTGPMAQLTVLKKYQNLTGKTSQMLFQAYWEYGMVWKISGRWYLSNSIGAGAFYRRYSNPGSADFGINHGLDARISFYLVYKQLNLN